MPWDLDPSPKHLTCLWVQGEASLAPDPGP